MYMSMALGTFPVLCSHHTTHSQNVFILPTLFPLNTWLHSPFIPNNPFLLTLWRLLWAPHRSGTTWHLSFWVCILQFSLSMMPDASLFLLWSMNCCLTDS
jgi:hypothetical protein